MKKFLVVLLSLFLSLFAMTPNIFSYANFNDALAVVSGFSEENLTNVTDIVPTEKSEMPSNLSSKAKEGETPYDTSSSSPMSGASVEPSTYGSYSQINTTYEVKEFSVTTNSSIYMWIFFPDSNFYDLTIKFTSSEGSYFSWALDWSELSTLTAELYSEQYGWKLFEFSLSDANISSENIYNETFSSMFIAYEMEEEIELLKKTSSNTFAFYHVYVADKTSTQTDIVKIQNYSYYTISEDFLAMFKNLLVGDTLTFGTFESIFSNIYVAKFDLKKTTNTLYSWSGSITTSGSESQDIYNGESVIFDSSGWCSIDITLNEYRSSGSITVLSCSNSVYIEELSLGTFVENSFKLTEEKTLTINFQISNNFVFDGDIVVSVGDKSIASVSYYVNNNICYITITGESEGTTTLTVTADGGKGDGEVSTYSKSVTIEVEGKESGSFSKIFLWVMLIVYLIGIIIYAIITIVRAKKIKIR